MSRRLSLTRGVHYGMIAPSDGRTLARRRVVRPDMKGFRMGSSRYSALASAKHAPSWTMGKAKSVLAEKPNPNNYQLRDAAYHWLLDRLKNKVAGPRERVETKELFKKANQSGDLEERRKVRDRIPTLLGEL